MYSYLVEPKVFFNKIIMIIIKKPLMEAVRLKFGVL